MPRRNLLYYMNGQSPYCRTAGGTVALIKFARSKRSIARLAYEDRDADWWNGVAAEAMADALLPKAPEPPPEPVKPKDKTVGEIIKLRNADMGHKWSALWREAVEFRTSPFIDFFGEDTPITSITHEMAVAYKVSRIEMTYRGGTRTPTTIAHEIAMARAIAAYAFTNGYAPTNPFATVDFQAERSVYRDNNFYVDRMENLRMADMVLRRSGSRRQPGRGANECWSAAMIIGRETGARASELRALAVADIDWTGTLKENRFKAPAVMLRNTKTLGAKDRPEYRAVPLRNVDAWAALARVLSTHRRGEEKVLHRLQHKHTMTDLDWLFKLCGCKPIAAFWQNLRRSVSEDHKRAGTPPKVYEYLMGHTLRVGMSNYQSVGPDDLKWVAGA